jgi:hypothetical protein
VVERWVGGSLLVAKSGRSWIQQITGRASAPEQSRQGGESDNGAHHVEHIHGIVPCYKMNFSIRPVLPPRKAKTVQASAGIFLAAISMGKPDSG